jgi:Rha family phage regulatory protein
VINLNQLKIISQNGKLLTDSRDVAEMVGKRHNHLLRDIDGYVAILTNSTEPKIGVSDFFIESTYQDSTGRTLPHYYITKKGCDMVANKMTGKKGVLFTATYVTKFEEMEKKESGIDVSLLTPEMQMFKHMFDGVAKMQLENAQTQKELTEVKETVETIQETFLQRDEDWRKSINTMLNGAAFRSNQEYRNLRNESYNVLEERGKCDLSTRLRNYTKRLEECGATKTQIKNANKMDVIESDARLREIYTMIVKELSIGSLKVTVNKK